MSNRIDTCPNRNAPSWRRQLLSRVLALSAVAVLSAAVAPGAYAADDDDEPFETKIIKGLLGINDKDSIDYRERPPLVVPPNLNNLPSPETNALVNNPAWPKDPEVVERKKREKARKETRRKTFEEEGRALTPAELDPAGRGPVGAGRIPNPTGPQDPEGQQRALRPSELGYKGGLLGALFKDNTKPEQTTFTAEPSRSDLTQPPAGYRTPSPNHPYGISPKQEQAKPYNYKENHGTTR